MGKQTGGEALRATFSIRMEAEASGLKSSSLVPSETNPHPLDRQSHAQELIHGRIEQHRWRIIEALWGSGEPNLEKRAGRMGLCCVSPQICIGAGEAPVCIAGYCRDRMCPTCMRRRAFKVRCRVTQLVCSMNSPRFLTLTERDNGSGLAQRLDDLSAAVRTLRRTKVWKKYVRGGVMVWETKNNVAADTWHPHLHLIIDGSFFPHAELHAEWKRILGRDGTCDLKPVHDRAAAARYIGSYLAKDNNISGWPQADLCEFANAMHRRRLVATFGSSHNVNLDICDKEPEPPPIPSSVIGFSQLRDAIIAGVVPAKKAAPLLARMGGAWRQLFVEFAPQEEVEGDVLTAEHTTELAAWIDELNGLLGATPIEEVHDPGPLLFEGEK